MTEDDDVFQHPESYGIENIESPGEPNRDELPPVSPVPGTGRQAREAHMREHDEQGNTPPEAGFKERKERAELDDIRRDT